MKITSVFGKILFEDDSDTFKETVENAVSKKIKLSYVNLHIMDLRDLNLENVNLKGASLSGADLSRANLSGANLSTADFINTLLINTNLSGADLLNAYISGADLYKADLSGADLSNVDFSHSKFVDTNFTKANFSNTTYGANIRITRPPIQLDGDLYDITIFDTHIKIGCELHSAETWFNFTDQEIIMMDGKRALIWWRKFKPIIEAYL